MKNNLEILIDFLVDFKYDKKDIDKISNDVEKLLSNINPDIKLDVEDFKKNLSLVENEFEGIEQIADLISKSLDGLNLDGFIDDVNKTGSIIDQMANAIDEIDFDNIDLDGVADAFDNLDLSDVLGKTFNDSLQKSKGTIKDLEQGMAQMILEGKKGTPEFAKMEKELSLARIETEKMEDALAEVSKTAGSTSDVLGEMASFGDRMATFGLAAQGINTIASGIQDLAKPFVELDTATQKIKTLGGAAKELAPEFRTMALEMSNALGASAGDIQLASYDALSAGISATKEDLGAFMEASTKLAIGGSESIGNSVNILSSQVNAYGLAATDAAKVSDILFNTVNLGKTSIPELSSGLANVIPTASSLGIELENVGGALATMTAKGIPTAQSTSKLNALFIELAKPGAALAPILEKAGVSLESLNRDDLPDTLGRINTALKESGKASIEVFSSSEAGAAFSVLAGDIGKFAETVEGVKNTTGSTQAAYEDMANGIETRTKAITNAVDNLVTAGFDKLGNSFTVIAGASAQLAPTVTTMVGLGQALPIDKMKQFSEEALKTAKNFTSLNGAKLNFAGAQAGIKGLTNNLSKLGPLLTNPWVLAGAGIALFLTQTEQGQELLAKLGDKGEELLEKLRPIGEVLLDIIGVGIEGGIDLVMQFVDVFSSVFGIIEDVASALFSLAPGFSSLNSGVNGTVSVLDLIKDNFKSLFDVIAYFPLSLQVISEGLRGLVQNTPELIGAFVEYMKVKLNPANWFGEDGEAEKQAEDRLNQVLTKALSGAKNVVTDFKLGKSLEESLEIKGDLDKQNKIGDLLTEYEKTTDDVKKNDLAKLITENFPEAISGYKQIIDASGNVVEAIDLNIDKAKELNDEQKKNSSSAFAKEQEKFTNVLKEQAVQYAENKKRAVELANEIVEKSKKGIDTSTLEKDYKDVQNSLKEQTEKFNAELSEANKVGFKISNVEFPQEFTNNFADQLSKVVSSPNIIKATKGLDDLLVIKGDVDKNNRMNELVTKFKNAKSEIEKQSIAEEIKKSVPDAVNSIGTMVDETGKLVTQYEVAGDKIDDYVKSQNKSVDGTIIQKKKEINKAILSEITAYDKVKSEVTKKQKEINDAKAKGLNTKELETEYKTLISQTNSLSENLISTIAKAKLQGADTEEQFNNLAKSLGKSPSEVKKIIEKQIESINQTKLQIKGVDELAGAWDNAKKSVDENIKSQTSALSELSKQLKDPKLSKEERQLSLNQYRDIEKTIKGQVKEKKNLEAIEERILIATGQKEVEDNRLAKAKELLSIKSSSLDIEMSNFKLFQNEAIISEKRKRDEIDDYNLTVKSLSNITQQNEAWIEILKTKKLVKEVKADGEIVFQSRIKEADKLDIQKSVSDFNIKYREELNKLEEIKLKIQVDSNELDKQFKEIQKNRVDWEIQVGIRAKGDYRDIFVDLKNQRQLLENDFIESNKKLSKLNDKLYSELQSATNDFEKDSIKLRNQNLINEEKKKNLELSKLILDSEKQIFDIENKYYQDGLKEIDNYYNKRANILKDNYSNEMQILNDFLSNYNNRYNAQLDSQFENENNLIDKSIDEKTEKLEKQKDNEILSIQSYEKRKRKIEEEALKEKEKLEEEYRKKRLIADGVALGVQIEAQRRADEQILLLEKEKINKELLLLKDKNKISDSEFTLLLDLQKQFKALELSSIENSNDEQIRIERDKAKELLDLKLSENKFNFTDFEQFDNLSDSLNSTEELLKQKSDGINQLALGLQETVTGTLDNLYNGDPEAALDNWRKYFSSMAGMLQKKLSGFVLDLLLTPGVLSYLNAIPFPLNLVATAGAKVSIDAAMRKIANPIINSILSFPTGGKFTEPTLAMVGDGSKLGMPNREWLLNDPQLMATVRMATDMGSKDTIKELRALRQDFQSLRLESSIEINSLRIALKKSENIAKLREI